MNSNLNLLVALLCFFAGTLVMVVPPLCGIDVFLGLLNYVFAVGNLYFYLRNS